MKATQGMGGGVCLPALAVILLSLSRCGGGDGKGDAATDVAMEDTGGEVVSAGDLKPGDDLVPADAPLPGDTVPGELPEPPPEGPHEVAVFTAAHGCVGCVSVSVCGSPPMSDSYVVTLDAAPNEAAEDLFAAERWEAAGRGLPMETCMLYVGDALDPVIQPPQGIDVLDAGDLTFGAQMTLFQEPIVLGYSDITHNYPSVANPPTSQAEWPSEYAAGAAITLDGSGGADWSAFGATDLAPEPFDILTPHTDGDGKIQNIATDEPLEVTWTGGGDFEDVVLYLQGEYCPNVLGNINFILACHAKNDGSFTIPAEELGGITWPNFVHLTVTASRKVPLDVAEAEGEPAWTVRSHASLPVYHDPDASPFDFTCTSQSMAEGFVGNACAADADCGGGCCLPEFADAYYKDNYGSLADCGDGGPECPADAVCVNDYWDTPWQTYCAKKCASDADCRPPEIACLPTDAGHDACVPAFW